MPGVKSPQQPLSSEAGALRGGGRRRFGRTGWMVSEVGLGLWGMGSWPDRDDRESAGSLRLAVDLGCNFFDTAWDYGQGRSDSLLGDLIASCPGQRLFAATKVPPRNFKWPADAADAYESVFSRDHVLEYARRCRDLLRVPTIDLLQLHVWDDAWTTHPQFAPTIAELKTSGLIRHFGLSLNRGQPWNGVHAIQTGLVDAVQVVYNIFDQAAEDALFPACRQHDVAVIVRVPLDEGSLGGGLTRASRFAPDDFRARYFGEGNLERTVERIERLTPLVPQGMTLAQMALAFVLSNPVVSTVIVGMRKERHVRANLAADAPRALSQPLLARLREHRWDR
jgi:aryl-alcohol dehydrogenase-like predicted oxidoreductase